MSGNQQRQWWITACVVVMLWGAVPGVGLAQTQGHVEGRTVATDGRPIPGVTVSVRQGEITLAVQAVSDESGAYMLHGLPVPGVYQLVATLGTVTETGPQIRLTADADHIVQDVRLTFGVTEAVSVTSDVWTLPVLPPNSVVTRTAEQLRNQNLFNPEDSIRALPSTTSRKRYIGDRNALVGGRSFGTLQPSRALVYLEGYLLSNFLGRFDAPRWNMVTPEALERVDVLYGPFSAVHAGNSIGTTIVMTERTPARFEWGVRATSGSQQFHVYADEDTYHAGQVSAYVGARSKTGAWAAVAVNRQTSTSQPMQWFTVSTNDSGTFPSVTGAATQVTGIQYDIDPRGLRRAVFGANSGAIDRSTQDAVKVRAGYLKNGVYEISVLGALWRNDSRTRNTTFLTDSTGQPVWQGRVTDGVNRFTIPATAFAPSVRDELHSQAGLTLRTRRATGWNGSFVVSDYRILDDVSRLAAGPDPVAAVGGSGTATRRDGTGWATFELQATRQRTASGRHAITIGAHRNVYRLDNVVRNSTDWRSNETTLAQQYVGRTAVNALYAQDVVQVTGRVAVTLGLRSEWFSTWDGAQTARVNSCVATTGATCQSNGDGTFNKVLAYARRTQQGHSPKASVTWMVSDHLLLRGSYGRGVRFANVEELYNGTVTATSVAVSDPNLRAERAHAVELSAERFWAQHVLRATYFYDDVRDAILRQSDITVTPSVVRTSNVDRVATPGLELVYVGHDVWRSGIEIEANATFADSKVLENSRDPLMVGKYWLRVPKTRGSILVAWRPNATWMASVGFRHQGRSYSDVYNRDVVPNVYAGVSTINQVDVRFSLRPSHQTELAFGVDNVAGQRAFVSHPFPGRTWFAELRLAGR